MTLDLHTLKTARANAEEVQRLRKMISDAIAYFEERNRQEPATWFPPASVAEKLRALEQGEDSWT